MKRIWLLVIRNLSMDEVTDLFLDGLEYETVRGEIHIQYERKRHLMEDLSDARAMASREIDYEIDRAWTVPVVPVPTKKIQL